MAPMLLNYLNLATGMQDQTPLDAQDLRKSSMNSQISNPFSENEISIYTDHNHAARQIYHAARGCSFSTTPRVKLHHAARDQGRGELIFSTRYYAARRLLHTPGVVVFFLHAARDIGSGKSIF
ncbi:hypothetical protein L195_g039658 [Trifolium pratense]|uniref:Uncharacterized protein n=1 Tax=Trifolium pratense TaxID=57577 RepID=A0A2K3LYK3_TRIPR|nr:hypothetical protein L195_g039658 [Trifolium pratense]